MALEQVKRWCWPPLGQCCFHVTICYVAFADSVSKLFEQLFVVLQAFGCHLKVMNSINKRL